MGDRISISFVREHQESVVLFSHWRGKDLLESVKQYLVWLDRELFKRSSENSHGSCPIDRRRPNIVMLDFIRWLTKDYGLVTKDLYLGKDEDNGDNFDNGHFRINLLSGEISKELIGGEKHG